MKATFYLLLLSCTLLFTCNDILDKNPIGILDAGSFLQTSADAVQAVNAAYASLLFNNSNNNFYWAFAEVCSDEAIAGGDGSRPGIVELDFFTYTPRTQEFNDFWRVNYKGIAQCNTVIEQVPLIDMEEGLQNILL